MSEVRFRRGTAAWWTTINPVLGEGEPAHERDTGKLKVGDGTTAWASLAYTSGAGAVSSVAGRTGAVTLVSTDVSDFAEAAQDAVAAALAGATGATVTYNDAAGTITITGIGDPETMRDTLGAALVGVGVVTVTVNDSADTITISSVATQNSTDAALRDRSTHTGTQAESTVTNLVSDLAAKAPVVLDWFTASAWPTRPSGSASQHWVGPASAGQPSGALVGDLVDLVQGV